MKNVKMEVKNDILTITIDLKENFGPSVSKKSIIIASTESNGKVPGKENMTIDLNIYKKI